jgi:hypothetical protein
MKPRDQKQIVKLEDDLQEYYNWWFMHWYDGDDWCSPYDFSEYWDWYQEDVTRIRQEKLDEIFDINQPETLKDIWPKQ